jgi:hypothetical protein
MPRTLLAGDILRTRFFCSAGDQGSVNTIYWQVTAVLGDPTTDLNAAEALDNRMGPFFRALMPSTAEYDGVTCQVVRTPAVTAQVARAAAGAGTGGAIAMPRQVTSLVSFLTENAGRKYRGRVYLPFPPIDAATPEGLMTAAYALLIAQWSAELSATIAFANHLTGATGQVSVNKVIMHFLKKGQAGPPEPPTVITNIKPGELFATQRRRGSFGRTNASPV